MLETIERLQIYNREERAKTDDSIQQRNIQRVGKERYKKHSLRGGCVEDQGSNRSD